ncbi:Lysosomal acid glucosylceramidase [Frankliniella fusca]|uniref:Glucosylceramidase n=1 Tax=Frankliniella fusca TaxID=407009 RepID=A0AAE1L7Y2_9NEOP|nr:Lysosomal acid glucosylceramidase [Frankliniella fusca]
MIGMQGITFKVNGDKKYQSIIGWGATVTDSTGINFQNLSEETKKQLIRAFFSEDGVEYDVLRVPIGGTDCSTRVYTLHDEPGDASLSGFALAEEDYLYKIPVLRAARAALPADRPLRLLASAWTAPPWMKTNNDYTGRGLLREDFYQAWADYHLKFLDAYEAEGFHYWGITTGNEPINGLVDGVIRFNSMGWTPGAMRTWLGQHLGPTLRGTDGRGASQHADVKILILDDQRVLMPLWTSYVVMDKDAVKYVDGFAIHWYANYLSPLLSLEISHIFSPDKFIFNTEASNGFQNWDRHVVLGSWERAEAYADDILDDLNHWVTGWMEWSLVLDMQGGPTWSGNYVDASILVNGDEDEFVKQPTFYAMGHFTKFLPPDSVRVDVDSAARDGVRNVAFLRPDNGTVVVLYNPTQKEKLVTVQDTSKGYLTVTLAPRSINTVIYW